MKGKEMLIFWGIFRKVSLRVYTIKMFCFCLNVVLCLILGEVLV